MALYSCAICELKYLTGVGKSPVRTSEASWYIASNAMRSGFTCPLNLRFLIAASACATMATCKLCSDTFSVRTLRISGQRLINFRRERWAKK